MKRWGVEIYGRLVALMMLVLWGLLKLTVRVRHVGRPADFAHRPTIDCAWHEALLPYFVGGMPYAKRYVWMNHPAWYMKGIHVFLRWMRVERLALGSSGHGGRRALEELVPLLQAGASTFLNPDGPYGPLRQVRGGVLELSQRTGLPVVAIRIRCQRAWRLPTWDRKFVPWPGSVVEFHYSPYWQVTPDNREAVRLAIRDHLGGAPVPS